jgi:hypothetical protein
MNFILDIFKNGIKYTLLFLFFIFLSVIFSILFTFGFIYYIKLWEIVPNDLHFLMLILLPTILIVGIFTTIIQRIFNGNQNKVEKQKPIDIIELANTIKKDIDNG